MCDPIEISDLIDGVYDCKISSTFFPATDCNATILGGKLTTDFELNQNSIYNLFFKDLDLCFTFKVL
jgi:hypothetical protein